LGLIDWLRRLVGAGSAKTAPPKIDVEPVVAVQRDRDELTSFISVTPTPEPVSDPEPGVDATVAVPIAADPESDLAANEQPAPDSDAGGLPDTPPVESEPQPSSDETLMLEVPPQTEDRPDQEATLFFQVARAVIGKLVVVKGELKGEQYDLREGDNQIGRSNECDVVLPSMWISRAHALMRCEMGRIEIESLSDKITSVDGEPVSGTVAVADGAKIQLGGTVCRVELEG
jgi:hypothetical protein